MRFNLLHFMIFFIAFISCQNKEKNTTSRPNVLLIMTDDQGWGDLSFHGNDSIFTPNLDALAQKSSRFERFYVSPVCAPTRASLLTGRYHLRTGTSWVTHRKEVMRSEETTIAEIFKENDYATGCFGKWHNGEQYPNDPNGQGFKEFFGFKAGHWNNYFDTKLHHNQKEVKTEGFITDVLTDKAIDFIQKNRSNPFFCYVPYNAPHSPFQVPDEYFDKYKNLGLTDKNASVYGMVENIDDNVGRLLKTLDSFQILENTIVIFLTDNGPNGQRFNGGMRGWKGKVHEGGVRVPCFVYWKNHLPENQEIQPIAAHIDLLPTLAELCEIPLPEGLNLDGKSLVPLLKDNTTHWANRSIYTIHTEGEMHIHPAAVRTEDYRMVVDYGGTPHLFDMKNDPSETNDLAEEKPKLLDSLKNDLENWFADVTQTEIKVPPIPIGFSEAPITFLPAPETKLSGNLQFKGRRGWANDYIINWKEVGDAATWEVDVQEQGEYEILLQYNCSEDFVGSVLEIENGEQNLKIPITKKFDAPFLSSPDRVKRGEVFEKEWGLTTPIKMTFRAGQSSIKISLIEMTNSRNYFELKGLAIVR